MTDISLPVTSIAAIANALILLILTARVIVIRRRDHVVHGDNGDPVLIKAIRGQANAAEQIPMAVVLLALAELQGGPSVALIGVAILFTIGRSMHATYFAIHGTPWRLRFYGMLMTLIAQIGFVLALALAIIA